MLQNGWYCFQTKIKGTKLLTDAFFSGWEKVNNFDVFIFYFILISMLILDNFWCRRKINAAYNSKFTKSSKWNRIIFHKIIEQEDAVAWIYCSIHFIHFIVCIFNNYFVERSALTIVFAKFWFDTKPSSILMALSFILQIANFISDWKYLGWHFAINEIKCGRIVYQMAI